METVTCCEELQKSSVSVKTEHIYILHKVQHKLWWKFDVFYWGLCSQAWMLITAMSDVFILKQSMLLVYFFCFLFVELGKLALST